MGKKVQPSKAKALAGRVKGEVKKSLGYEPEVYLCMFENGDEANLLGEGSAMEVSQLILRCMVSNDAVAASIWGAASAYQKFHMNEEESTGDKTDSD